MLKTLRRRLLVSYALILLITLAVMAVALLITLRARPLPTEETSRRLATILFTIEARSELSRIPPNGLTRFQRQLLNLFSRQAFMRNIQARVVVLGDENIVHYDSMRVLDEGETLTLEAAPYLPADVINDTPALERGTFTVLDSTQWRFVAQSPSDRSEWRYLIAVSAPEILSLSELLALYGDDLLSPLLQAGLVGLLVAFIAAYFVAQGVSRPLSDVAGQVAKLAQGDSDVTAPVRGPREVRVVAETFNLMVREVAATQEAQREFLANVTHDLRTPLTSIQGFSQAIIDGVAANPESAQRAARVIHDEAGRLNRMVEELLDLARIEAGRWTMTRHTVNLNELLNVVIDRLTHKAQAKQIALALEDMPLPNIAGDGDRLVQVFTNLVDNAIKHTPEHGRVRLRALFQDAGILVEVMDTGVGIPADDLPRIFDRFYQVDKSRQRSSREGVGLGLTITKQIVEAHGGKISVSSDEGNGTTFSVWLPAPTSDMTTLIRRRSAAIKRTQG